MAKKSSKYFVPGIQEGRKRRPSRVADIIQSEVALLLLHKVKDPRLRMLNITSVSVTDDLRHARVYFSCADDAVKSVEEGLARSKGFIRSSLAGELQMRYVPDLEFRRDLSSVYHEEIDRLLKGTGEDHEV